MNAYRCSYNQYVNISELEKEVDFNIKSALFEVESMTRLARYIKDRNGDAFCRLPFDHVLESESIGGNVVFDEKRLELRRGQGVCKSLKEVLDLPKMDATKGRMNMVLQAAVSLISEGEPVALNVCGPITTLNGLVESEVLFLGLRKDKELMRQVLKSILTELRHYVEVAISQGVRIISYGDPLGGADILGPKLEQELIRNYIYPWLYALQQSLPEDGIIVLCPKTTCSLMDMGLAEEYFCQLPETMTYQEAILYMRGQGQFVGMGCLNNSNLFFSKGRIIKILGEGK